MSPASLFGAADAKEEEGEMSEEITEKPEQFGPRDCPICLEVFEEGNPSVIILCNHKFHMKCLKDWGDQTCPVCRYQQYPFELTFCEKCDQHKDLWCCIICGFIGCGGSYPISGHSSEHAAETMHIYAKPIIKEISSKPKGIWDHSKKDFIHSLVYNRQQRSIQAVEYPDEKDTTGKDGKEDKKNHDVTEEINQLISAQLDSQRQFYEEELKKLDAEYIQYNQANQDVISLLQGDIKELEAELAGTMSILEDAKKSNNEVAATLGELNQSLETFKKANNKLRKSKKGVERDMEARRDEKRKQLYNVKSQINEMIAQIKDMKTHIENKKKIEGMPVQIGSPLMILSKSGPKKKK